MVISEISSQGASRLQATNHHMGYCSIPYARELIYRPPYYTPAALRHVSQQSAYRYAAPISCLATCITTACWICARLLGQVACIHCVREKRSVFTSSVDSRARMRDYRCSMCGTEGPATGAMMMMFRRLRGVFYWLQAGGQYEAALLAYDQALASSQRRKISSAVSHPANSQFVQERILECYSALSDWDGLKLRLASLEVCAPLGI